MATPNVLDKRLDRIDAHLERLTKTMADRFTETDVQIDSMAKVMVKGFATATKDRQIIRDEVQKTIDVYARAVDAYA